MCKAMEEMIADFVAEEKKMAAVRMLEKGRLPKEEIADYLDLSLSVVEQLSEELLSV